MASKEIDTGISELREHISDLLNTLATQMTDQRLEEIVENGATLRSSNLGQKPERCIEDTLIWPTLETLGFNFTPRPYYPVGDESDCPDFRIDNLTHSVIGENKSANNFRNAKTDIRGYLDSTRYDYGITTDGFRWAMYTVEVDRHGHTTLVDVVARQELIPAVQRIARERKVMDYTEKLHSETSVDGILGEFYQTFNHYEIGRKIGGLSEFYDLWLELLAGNGEYERLELNLVSSVDAPRDATEREKLAFAALFLDRLAFLQVLIDRRVLTQITPHKRWEAHNRGLNRFRGSFYKQYFQPLFYSSLATQPCARESELPQSFRELPCLAGSLFNPLLTNERDYDIPDELMQTILSRFEDQKRTVINEAARSSLLQTYTEELETDNIAGKIPQQYATIVNAYADELAHVESQVEQTLRSFADSR